MLHVMGKTYGVRPSEIIDIDDKYIAYQFDTACLMIGLERESEAIKEATNNSNNTSIDEFAQTMQPTVILPKDKSFEEFWKEL
jgi:hypothetical protein